MAQFKIPESPTFNYLDLNNLQGMDSWNTNPSVMRAADMLNVVKKDGLHQVRHNVKQDYLVGSYEPSGEIDDDVLYDIKYIGKVEEYDENGNTVPYYIKISEYLGELNAENASRLYISVWPTPAVQSIGTGTGLIPGYEKYLIDYKIIPFTNYGVSGNRQGLYEHINYDGKEWIFTPIGILSFKCSEFDVQIQYGDDDPIDGKQLQFEIENVMDNPYVPTVIYGSTPDGLDFTKYESINLLSDRRKAQFLGDVSSTNYKLPEQMLDPNYCKVRILQSDGVYTELTSGFTLNGTTGVVTFDTAPGVTPIDGKDNIIIEYKKLRNPTSTTGILIDTVAGDNMFDQNITISRETDPLDSSKIKFTFTCSASVGTNFDGTVDELNAMNSTIKMPTKTYDLVYTPSEIADLNNQQIVTRIFTESIDKSLLSDDFVWKITLNATYTKTNGGSSTVIVPGSVAEKTVYGSTDYVSNQFSWMGFRINGEVEGTVGNNIDGSDSYWTVRENVQVWLSRAEYLNCNAGTLFGNVDGIETEIGSTGTMYGTSTVYPSTPVTLTKKIMYDSNKASVSLSARMNFYAVISGVPYTQLTMTPFSVPVPAITLPREETTGGDVTLTETGVGTYIDSNYTRDIIYDNIVPGSARLGCYYGAKCVTVYGYESDRRVFVSDGTNRDTYSGVTLDGTSSIYYFPDDNYNVLGEDTEILGYAQKHGYLLTFKRGEDSVYVRYGTSINKDTVFPSSAVTRNLQILSRPIQIEDEILVVTRNGIKSVNYINNEIRTELRSYFINNYFELGADYNYDRMSWFVEDNLLHIFLDDYEFTADLVSKSYVREGSNFGGTRGASTLDFQYEWYVSEYRWMSGLSSPQVTVYQPKDFERQTSGVIYDKQRAIGYTIKGTYEFFYDDYKVDVLLKKVDDTIYYYFYPIPAHYITPFLNMDAINVAKTIKYVYINTRSKPGDMFAVGYIDENGKTETMHKEYTNFSDYPTKFRNIYVPFPKLIQIKSKIRKFMNVKLYIQNQAEYDMEHAVDLVDIAKYGNMTFDRILVQYQIAGKYRGE